MVYARRCAAEGRCPSTPLACATGPGRADEWRALTLVGSAPSPLAYSASSKLWATRGGHCLAQASPSALGLNLWNGKYLPEDKFWAVGFPQDLCGHVRNAWPKPRGEARARTRHLPVAQNLLEAE